MHLLAKPTRLRAFFVRLFLITVLALIPPWSFCAAKTQQPAPGNHRHKKSSLTYYVEISISRRILDLYQKTDDGSLELVDEYPVGTAVRGLDVYPLGLGKVTGIYFDPWWYPTPYSRQVFRERGIDLPSKVPPGDPLNYMGPFKIALSHRTRKGAIYRIHGNNNPKRVGRRVTGGCFVMYNTDGLSLAHTIQVGTEVNIVP